MLTNIGPDKNKVRGYGNNISAKRILVFNSASKKKIRSINKLVYVLLSAAYLK